MLLLYKNHLRTTPWAAIATRPFFNRYDKRISVFFLSLRKKRKKITCPVNMPVGAGTGPVLTRCWQHRASTGLVPAHNGMFTGWSLQGICLQWKHRIFESTLSLKFVYRNWVVSIKMQYHLNMPLVASTGPVLVRCCQHRSSTGPVLAHNGMFMGYAF